MRRRSSPSPLLIVLVGALLVFGGYYVWIGFIAFLDDQGDITAQVTRQALSTATARSASPSPTLYIPATFTPLPPCIDYRVNVDRAVYRECASTDNTECPIIDVVPYGTQFCVYSRVDNASEWFAIDLNPDGAFREMVYMHESVIEPANPTATPHPTVRPRPTITPTVPGSPAPSATQRPTVRPRPTITPTPH